MGKKTLFFFVILTGLWAALKASAQETTDQARLESLTVTLGTPLVVTPDEATVAVANFLEVIESREGKKQSRPIIGLEDVKIEGVLAPQALNHTRRDGTLSKSDLQRIGGFISWTAVSLEKENQEGEKDVKRALLPSPLQSTIQKDTVQAGSRLDAKGDINAAIQTAQNLLKEEKKTILPEAEEPEKEEEKAPEAKPQAGGGSSAGGSEGGNSLGETKSYQIEEPEPAPVLGTSTEGCAPVPVIAQLIVQETSRITEDGTPKGECAPSGTDWTLHKGTAQCEDVVRLEEMKAYGQFKYYYVNTTGQTAYVGPNGEFLSENDDDACQIDTEAVFDIYEDAARCKEWREDFDEMKAYPASQLIYVNRSNKVEEVTDCRDHPEAEPVDIKQTDDICGITDNFVGKFSTQMVRFVYDKEGSLEQALACHTSSITYVHQTDRDTCRDIEIFTEGQERFQKQIRIYIETPTQPFKPITACEPDPENSFSVHTTTSGCDTDFRHDLQGGISLGTKKYYYTDNDGQSQFLKGGACQPDTKRTYTHEVRIASYKHVDEDKESFPLMEPYIETEFGERPVAPATLKADAVGIPYEFVRSQEQQTSNITYEGCNKFTEVATFEVYKNADGQEVTYQTGTGTPVGPENVCVVEDTCKSPSGWSPTGFSYGPYSLSWHENRGTSECNYYFGSTPYGWLSGGYLGAHKTYGTYPRYTERVFTCELRTMREDGVLINSQTLTEQANRTNSIGFFGDSGMCYAKPNPTISTTDLSTIRAKHGF